MSDTYELRGRKFKNRIVMAPLVTFSFTGDGDEAFGKMHTEHYRMYARGGAGLIFTQSVLAFGAGEGKRMWTPHCRKILAGIADDCHENGAVAMMQISLGKEIADINAISADELRAVTGELVASALWAEELGFDGVEFHCGHGNGMSKLVHAEANTRTDEFGGSAENRARVLTGAITEIRAKTGDGFIIAARTGECIPTREDGVEFVGHLKEAGLDMLDITYGLDRPDSVPDGFPLSPMVYSGSVMRRECGLPTLVGGGLRSAGDIEYLFENDLADFAVIGCGMLADPEFANHVLSDEPVNTCASCKSCMWFTDHTKCPARMRTMK